jgi:hypothetical protein
LADLLAVPGASRTILEAVVPYNEKALALFLGRMPEHAVSIVTATALARTAYQRAVQLRDNEAVPVIGLSCTATLVTDRPKKGEHRAHVGLCDVQQTQIYSLTLQKGARNRQGEERVVSDLLLRVLAKACTVVVSEAASLLSGEHITKQVIEPPKISS